jgi:HSP20 family protein
VSREEVVVMATRYDPFGDTARWMDQLLGAMRETTGPAVPALPMDLYRDGDHYVMHVDLPGADPGSIDVNVEDRTLTIRAERTGRTESDVQWLARERPTGTYVRQLTVGRGLALDAIEAGYADGVLTLTVPVAEEAKPRRVEVRHSGSRTEIGSGDREDASA